MYYDPLIDSYLYFQDQVKYRIQTNNATWMEAAQACSLAIPTLNISASWPYTVDFNNSNIQLEKGETYWIGYQMGYKTFKYEGKFILCLSSSL